MYRHADLPQSLGYTPTSAAETGLRNDSACPPGGPRGHVAGDGIATGARWKRFLIARAPSYQLTVLRRVSVSASGIRRG
jgi:hypothetical protein